MLTSKESESSVYGSGENEIVKSRRLWSAMAMLWLAGTART